jgi:uncharacterized repeat protein (TIGR03803 family)
VITTGSAFVKATNPSLRKAQNTLLSRCFDLNRRFSREATLLAMLRVLIALSTAGAQAQTYAVLYAFEGTPDGAAPAAGVLRDAKGNLYGTTTGGGPTGLGTVFKLESFLEPYGLQGTCERPPDASLQRGSDEIPAH